MFRALAALLTIAALRAVPASAEYRVFVLKIETPGQEPQTLLSTLDPWQYVGYYPVKPDARVTYINTWRCRGRTDGLPFCPDPRAPASVEGPESAAPAPKP